MLKFFDWLPKHSVNDKIIICYDSLYKWLKKMSIIFNKIQLIHTILLKIFSLSLSLAFTYNNSTNHWKLLDSIYSKNRHWQLSECKKNHSKFNLLYCATRNENKRRIDQIPLPVRRILFVAISGTADHLWNWHLFIIIIFFFLYKSTQRWVRDESWCLHLNNNKIKISWILVVFSLIKCIFHFHPSIQDVLSILHCTRTIAVVCVYIYKWLLRSLYRFLWFFGSSLWLRFFIYVVFMLMSVRDR